MVLEEAPAGFDVTLSIDPSVLGSTVAEREDADGRELVIADGSGEVHVRWRDGRTTRRPVILLPLDSMFEVRLDVALGFIRRLRGQRVGLLPRTLQLTAQQRSRQIQLLHTFDVHDAGGGPRDVAVVVLSSDQAQLPSVEWKDSHTRRKANRFIHDSIALVERGYLKLLRGG